ncbi:MAG: NAD(P)H-dependent oxidoreductase [Acidobacteriia bacterium]|nr:NAD(P)H-dependent oxidoreductase [Terriglobia bacterium]
MANEEREIRIVVINGSVRPNNYTSMASALVVDELKKDPKVTVHVINPLEYHLPFPGIDPNAPGTKRLQDEVKNATAVIFATPEYHGSFSSMTKLVIENLGFPSVLAGKPVGLLGVAAGSIGAIKSLEHLRGVCSHIGAIVLPLPISVANVQRVFDASGHILDPAVEKLIRSLAKSVMDYLHQNVCPSVTLERLLRSGIAVVEA